MWRLQGGSQEAAEKSTQAKKKGDSMLIASPIGAVMSVNTRPNLDEIVRKIRALKALHHSTGYSQNTTIKNMLDSLTDAERITVGESFLREPLNLTDAQ
jgi:hypothetical protein